MQMELIIMDPHSLNQVTQNLKKAQVPVQKKTMMMIKVVACRKFV